MAQIIVKDLLIEESNAGGAVRFDFTVEEGSLCVCSSENIKAGKSLFRIIAGVEKAPRGEIIIGGRNVENIHASERNTALIFQRSTLYSHMSIYQNLLFALNRLNDCVPNKKNIIQGCARLFSFEDCLDEKPLLLSPEKLFRAELGRAYISKPDAVLMYDPLKHFSGKTLSVMKDEVIKLRDVLRVSILYFSESRKTADIFPHENKIGGKTLDFITVRD